MVSVNRAARGNGSRVSRSATSSTPDHQSATADLANVRMATETRVEQRPEPLALDARPLDERLRLQDAKDLARDRSGDDVMAVCEAMDEGSRAKDGLDHRPDAAAKPNGQ